MSRQHRIPAVFMRGGTSKAIMLDGRDLPEDHALWPALFRAMLGSPDPHGRQLDGLGGGLSSLSKICVVTPSTRDDADVDYTFAQVSVTGTDVDFSGNCGNMSSAVGPFAVDAGLVPAPADGETLVRIFNTNSGKLIHARFAMAGGEAATTGEQAIPGVAGTGAPVALDFLEPGGTRGRGLLPAGTPSVPLDLPDGGTIKAGLVDAAIPAVFVRATDLGLSPVLMPDALDDAASTLALLEDLRQQASLRMGIADTRQDAAATIATPKIALVGPPQPYRTLSGEAVPADAYDLSVRMISAGQPHRAVPVTGALALACATALDGTPAAACARPGSDPGDLRLGTPSGVLRVGAVLRSDADGPTIVSARIVRTQRRLMEGAVCVPTACVPTALAVPLARKEPSR